MSDCECKIEIKNKEQRSVLYWLLAINLLMFFFEIGIGWIAESTALIADALDMLADAIVYGIALYAVGQPEQHKVKAALASGYFQGFLGLIVLVDIARRIVFGSDPESVLIIGMGFLALLANITCLVLLKKHKNGEVHMRATWIFSTNDVIANVGIIIGGLLVWGLDVRWPDIVIGIIISIIILRGSIRILQEAKN